MVLESLFDDLIVDIHVLVHENVSEPNCRNHRGRRLGFDNARSPDSALSRGGLFTAR